MNRTKANVKSQQVANPQKRRNSGNQTPTAAKILNSSQQLSHIHHKYTNTTVSNLDIQTGKNGLPNKTPNGSYKNIGGRKSDATIRHSKDTILNSSDYNETIAQGRNLRGREGKDK